MHKRKVLIAVVHRPGRSPSQRFRIEQFMPYLEENGYSFEYSSLINEKDDRIMYSPGNYLGKLRIMLKALWRRWCDVRRSKQFDMVFVQREAIMLGTSYFERQMAKHTKLVLDFDDAIWMLDVSAGNKALAFLKRPEKTADIAKVADLVIAGNTYLAAYAKQYNYNVVTIPTTVDTNRHKPSEQPKDNDTITIGWTGSQTTVPYFERIIPVLERIKKKYGDKVNFKLLGDGNYNYEPLDIQGIAWSEANEVHELQQMDIGIMPMPHEEWAKGKCGFKGLQYMAVGLPVVLENYGMNREIIQPEVNGLLAANDDEWYHCLVKLINNKELRSQLGTVARQTIISKYSLQSQKDKLLQSLKLLFAE